MTRPIGARVIDYEDLESVARIVELAHSGQRAIEYQLFVVSRNKQRDVRQLNRCFSEPPPFAPGTVTVDKSKHAQQELVDQHKPDQHNAEHERCVDQSVHQSITSPAPTSSGSFSKVAGCCSCGIGGFTSSAGSESNAVRKTESSGGIARAAVSLL